MTKRQFMDLVPGDVVEDGSENRWTVIRNELPGGVIIERSVVIQTPSKWKLVFKVPPTRRAFASSLPPEPLPLFAVKDLREDFKKFRAEKNYVALGNLIWSNMHADGKLRTEAKRLWKRLTNQEQDACERAV